jgi:hypothetical protein
MISSTSAHIQALQAPEKCRHATRLLRPAGAWGLKGAYCLDCGWRLHKVNGVLAWGDSRLSLGEVQSLRATLSLKPLPSP